MVTAFLLSVILFLAVALAMLAVTHYEARLDTAHLHRLLDAKDDGFDPMSPLAGLFDDDEPELPFTATPDHTTFRRYNKD